MYHSWNVRRFLRYVIFDLVLIFSAIWLTRAGKHHFAAVEQHQNGVFLPVLMYHSVAELTETQFCVTPQTIESDLRYLKEHGYEAVSAEALVEYTNGTGSLPLHPVLITLDDGFYNNSSLVLPLLEKYDMCAVISVVGVFTDVYAPDAPHQDDYSYLTWDDMREMCCSPRIEFGNHTYQLHSHRKRQGCAKLSWESEEEYRQTLSEDLNLLQTRFQEELHLQPIVFAYPYGFLCEESRPVLQEAGFLITLNCLEQPNFITRDPACLYGLNRYNREGGISTETYMARLLQMEP
ncbi:MAG: polysaccharide deacetylase family protein [Ruminococcus sp.]|uniref:polysaccharide deacetylase family protein n=1 Tax=Ruminococcus sp. TaxID=41978 RepID=UPI003995EEC8